MIGDPRLVCTLDATYASAAADGGLEPTERDALFDVLGLGGGVGGSPDFLALPLKANPIGRIALIDGRQWLLVASY